jgi:3-phosphoshikimate 1-carboxyvinyltransferase
MLTVAVPGSKSITQRALMACALSSQKHVLQGALHCDDSQALTELLKSLGHRVVWSETGAEVTPPLPSTTLAKAHCKLAGTTLRFGACLSLVNSRSIALDGDTRLRERPLIALLNALEHLGVSVEYKGKEGHLPFILTGPASPRASSPEVFVDSTESSQFISGLLLVAPYLPHGLIIRTQPHQVSKPYINMTLQMLQEFKVDAHERERGLFFVPHGKLQMPSTYEIEGDWSAAAFLYSAAHIANVDVRISNLPKRSMQGDSLFLNFLESFRNSPENAPTERHFSLINTPDLVAPLAALAAFSAGKTVFTGIAHARTKECDRIAVLARALCAVGCAVTEFDDGFSVEKEAAAINISGQSVCLNPMNDHRMAMAFGLLELGGLPVTILNKECVSKSYPDFWNTLDLIRSKKK